MNDLAMIVNRRRILPPPLLREPEAPVPAVRPGRCLAAAELPWLELLLAGFSRPLAGYLGRDDCAAVLIWQRLADGSPWPLPVLLPVDPELAAALRIGGELELRDAEGALLAVMTVDDVWSAADLPPAAAAALARLAPAGTSFAGGRLERVEGPAHHDFAELRLSAPELRAHCARRGWRRVLACQPADLIHRAEAARIVHAARLAQANVLLMAPVTEEQTLTPAHFTRVRCLQHALRYLPECGALLCLLPLPVGLPSGQQVLWRAILARNAGASHLLVEPEWWQGADEAERRRIGVLARGAGIELVDLPRFSRDSALEAFVPEAQPAGADATAEVVRRTQANLEMPTWLSFPEVVDELRRSRPATGRQGVTVFFTGLSGAGKSTIARALLARLLELGGRPATLLDGDVVRKHLSSELGYSRQHRDLNIERIGFVAGEITKHGGIAICAPIAPYAATRQRVRAMIEAHGGFVEVHVATPLETCEARDRKGLYAKARAGMIKAFTGISDPYEAPAAAELVIDSRDCTPAAAALMVVDCLRRDGFLS